MVGLGSGFICYLQHRIFAAIRMLFSLPLDSRVEATI